MNRRRFLMATLAIPLFKSPRLKVATHSIDYNKKQVERHGKQPVTYYADVVHMKLNDGTSADYWVDEQGTPNLRTCVNSIAVIGTEEQYNVAEGYAWRCLSNMSASGVTVATLG